MNEKRITAARVPAISPDIGSLVRVIMRRQDDINSRAIKLPATTNLFFTKSPLSRNRIRFLKS